MGRGSSNTTWPLARSIRRKRPRRTVKLTTATARKPTTGTTFCVWAAMSLHKNHAGSIFSVYLCFFVFCFFLGGMVDLESALPSFCLG